MLEGKTLKTKSFAHLKCTDGFLIRFYFQRWRRSNEISFFEVGWGGCTSLYSLNFKTLSFM